MTDRLARVKDILQRLRKHRPRHTAWIESLSVKVHNAEFFINRIGQIEMWQQSHPGEKVPTFVDPSGRVQWINRKSRKRIGRSNGK